MRLHTYFRSSAAFRVRIALNLKGSPAVQVPHDLRTGEQDAADYMKLNPQSLVPVLEIGGGVLTQSMAICEYLDECFPEPPLVDGDALRRAKIRSFAQAIACDIHPLQNLRVLSRLRSMGHTDDQVKAWATDWIGKGLQACEKLLPTRSGPFCFGAAPTLADVFLVPQLYNARRFGMEARWPRLLKAEAYCLELPAFQAALPENQADYSA